ncbi:unnamed protein product [Closterium sp. NIES-53]
MKTLHLTLSAGAIAGIVAAAVCDLLLLLLTGVLLYRRGCMKEEGMSAAATAAAATAGGKEGGVVVDPEAARPQVCQEYSMEELAKATAEWAEGKKIGSGGFGDVYKGVSPHCSMQVAPLVASSDVAAFKDPHLDALGDLVERMARLALTCTAMPTASRPTMGQVLVDLVKMKEEVVGDRVDSIASHIDKEMDISSHLDFNAEIAQAQDTAEKIASSAE